MKRADTDPGSGNEPESEDNETVVLGGDDPTVVVSETGHSAAPTAVSMNRSVASMSQAAPAPRRGLGLATKFFLAAALLVVATLGTAIAVTSWRANVVAEKTIREALRNAPTLFRAYRTDLESRLVAQVRSLADEPGTKALYAPDVSVATRYEWVREHEALLDARTVYMFDGESRVLARSDKDEGEGVGRAFGGASWVGGPLSNRRDSTAAVDDRGELGQVAAVAVVSGEGDESHVDGVLAASFLFGVDEVEALHGITRGQVAFLTAGRTEPADATVTASSSGVDGAALLAALGRTQLERLLKDGEEIGPIDVELGGETRLAMAIPIKSAKGTPYGAFVVSRSRSEETAAFREIQRALMAVGGLLLLLSVPISFATGRRIARPLEQLTDGAHAIRDGSLDVQLPQERGDEVGELARAFQSLVGELREKKALQELLEEMSRQAPTEVAPVATESAATADGGLRVGSTFGGRYKIQGSLGKGGMGLVFQATDVELDDVVALKTISSEAFKQGDKALEMLKKEIRLARKITHANVVRVHDFSEAEGVRFVSMEYVPGTTLRALMRRQPAMGLGPGLQIAKQLCRGLGAIHEAGILHRDMKPENAMVLPNGMVKLMDFGIAEALGEASGERKDVITGTPRYMSPEQLRNEAIDARADLYAVGVILYEMFTGVSLFAGKTLTEVVQKTMQQVPPRPSEHRRGMPPQLEKLILKCLEKDRNKRPASAAALYRGLLELPVSKG